MKFLIVTKIPARQGLIGTIPEKHVVETTEADDLDVVKNSVHIPLGGECQIVSMEHVITLKTRIVHEVVES